MDKWASWCGTSSHGVVISTRSARTRPDRADAALHDYDAARARVGYTGVNIPTSPAEERNSMVQATTWFLDLGVKSRDEAER